VASLGTHAVKVKMKNRGRWEFLTPGGGLTHLRIHAALSTPERCKEYADDILESNEDVEATKVVEIFA
jgi:hypothetical protein